MTSFLNTSGYLSPAHSPRAHFAQTWPLQDFALSKPTASQSNELPSLARFEEGQSAGSRGQACTGRVVSKSHTGPASQHASHCFSSSQLGGNQSSPSPFRQKELGDRDPYQDASKGDEGMQQVPQRQFRLHDILDSPETRSSSSEGSRPLLPAARPSDATPTQTVGPGTSPFQGAQSFLPGQPASVYLPGTSSGSMTTLGGPSSGCSSSTTALPFLAVCSTESKASPIQDPRAIIVSHAQSHDPQSCSPAKRPFEGITSEETRTKHPNRHLLAGIPVGRLPAKSDLCRLPLQGQTASLGTEAPLSNLPLRHTLDRPQPSLVHSQALYTPNMWASRPLPSPGPRNEAGPPWLKTPRRQDVEGSLFGVEGQHAFMTLPGSKTPISVHIDTSHGSRISDEKRQRNAVASTKHRRKKKEIQEEISKQLQELRDTRLSMETKIEELAQQRDFYRDDRDRLRDIVTQTPSISGLASGPTSPITSTSSCYAETGSLASRPSGAMGYGIDALSSERPAKRLRTDDHLKYLSS